MTQDLEALIRAAAEESPDGDRARRELSSGGVSAAEAVMQAVRKAELADVRRLSRLLLDFRGEVLVPGMIAALDDPSSDLSVVAREWLTRSGDERAFQVFRVRLLAPESSDLTRWQAADALGDIGDPRAIDDLRSTIVAVMQPGATLAAVQRKVDTTAPRALKAGAWTSASVALAKLGSHEAVPLVIALARYGRQHHDGEINIEATKALSSVVGPGVFDTLCEGLADADAEIVEWSLEGLLFLGTKSAVPAIISLFERSVGSYLGERAATWLHDLTGAFPPVRGDDNAADVRALADWWRSVEPNIPTEVCWRLGRPLDVAVLVERLAVNGERDLTSREFRIITGVDLHVHGIDPIENPDRVLEDARRWVRGAGNRLVRGRLYKYGFEQSMSRALEPWRTGL